MTRRFQATVFACVTVLVISACGHTTRAPISDKRIKKSSEIQYNEATRKTRVITRPGYYTVIRGDTLQAIAWKFGLNHRDLARWNKLRNPNLIYVGQKIRLSPPPRTSKLASAPSNKAVVEPNKAPPKKTTGSTKLLWRWPAEGNVSKATSALGTKGIEIRGKRGSRVSAAAPGKVVYSGNGLRGYGNLIIVQHNEVYLSAYAHNEKLLVSEGTKVSVGQAIATMGNSGTKQVMLHFEIRRNGKAVEPTNYLPRR
ncbi:MAG: peptidoglycan DD-metalloendopeptidase family protein [Gammaproteobacteria bacterium]